MRRLSMGLEGGVTRVPNADLPGRGHPGASLRLLSRRFEKLRRLVRRSGYRGEFEFGGVVELTQRAIAHFHVSVPGAVSSAGNLEPARGRGWVRRIVDRAASPRKLAGYVTKALPGYVTKELANPTAFPRHFRRVRFSRGWAPAWVVRRRGIPEEGPRPWALVRAGTSLMSAYLRVPALGNRADPDGWALEGVGVAPDTPARGNPSGDGRGSARRQAPLRRLMRATIPIAGARHCGGRRPTGARQLRPGGAR